MPSALIGETKKQNEPLGLRNLSFEELLVEQPSEGRAFGAHAPKSAVLRLALLGDKTVKYYEIKARQCSRL